MNHYVFMSNDGTEIKVSADDEDQARSRAMEKHYGPIEYQPEWVGESWVGYGLLLQRSETAP